MLGRILTIGAGVLLAHSSSVTAVADGFLESIVTAYQNDATHSEALRLLKRQREISNLQYGTAYTIDIEVGTPPQTATVLVDTGSSNLWLNPTCETSSQQGYYESLPQFNYNESSSLQDTSFAQLLSYGKGNASVEFVTDNTGFGSGNITDQIFGINLQSYSIPLGILGLSPLIGALSIQYSLALDSMASKGLVASSR